MANAMYSSFKERMVTDWFNGTGPTVQSNLLVYAVNDTYVFNPTHNTSADLGASVILTPWTLANPMVAGGIINADDLIRAHEGTGVIVGVVKALVFAFDTGVVNQLIAYIDTNSDLSLPFPLGIDITNFIWGIDGIFRY